MKKITVILSLLLALALALGGCGLFEEPEENPGGEQGQEQEQEQEQEKQPEKQPEGSGDEEPPAGKVDAIPFEEGQLYAAAYLGYQEIDDFDYYVEKYLDSADIPTHYISAGDYYLIIPRYAGTALTLSRVDIETSQTSVVLEEPDCGPFILQCNASDVFEDAVIRLEHEGEAVEFSPYISLENGEIVVGERGLDITMPGSAGPYEPAAGPADYVGEYRDAENDTEGLEIAANGDGTYTVQFGIFKLAQFTDGVGELGEDGLSFTATDPSGNPVSGLITADGGSATVTITASTWEYLPDGTSFVYEKSSDTPNLWEQN